jgi:hypothetical protein
LPAQARAGRAQRRVGPPFRLRLLGGRYRFEVGADGKVASSRRFLNSCFDLQACPPPQAASQPVGLLVSHLLDPQPTEIHAFASRYFPLAVFVGTMPSKLVWEVRGGRIRFVEPMPDEDSSGSS